MASASVRASVMARYDGERECEDECDGEWEWEDECDGKWECDGECDGEWEHDDGLPPSAPCPHILCGLESTGKPTTATPMNAKRYVWV